MKNGTENAKQAADEITKYDVKENGAIKHLLEMINER
jgi:hydroxymethylpyrimidine pyrophosphatase-like HAD family hydrolase